MFNTKPMTFQGHTSDGLAVYKEQPACRHCHPMRQKEGRQMRASARKSLGEYKPLIIHDSGRTEVVGKRGHVHHWVALTNSGETYHPRRGVTFASRGDAVAYAQRHIDRLQEFKARRDQERDERNARYAQQREHGGETP